MCGAYAQAHLCVTSLALRKLTQTAVHRLMNLLVFYSRVLFSVSTYETRKYSYWLVSKKKNTFPIHPQSWTPIFIEGCAIRCLGDQRSSNIKGEQVPVASS